MTRRHRPSDIRLVWTTCSVFLVASCQPKHKSPIEYPGSDAGGDADQTDAGDATDSGSDQDNGLRVLASVAGGPQAVVVDDTWVYWSEPSVSMGGGSIKKVAKTGGDVVVIASGQASPGRIAIDTSCIYWTNLNGGSVARATLDGATVETLVDGLTNPSSIAVFNGYVYFLNNVLSDTDGAVSRVVSGDGSPETLTGSLAAPSGIAVDGNGVYFASYRNGTILRVALTGGTPEPLATGQVGPAELVVDQGVLYWTNMSGRQVMRLALASPSSATTIAGLSNYPMFIAVDSAYVYCTDIAGNINQARRDGSGSVVLLKSGQGAFPPVAVDSAAVYWSTGSNLVAYDKP
jgi:hypothetical protein